jgi:hypothetical protein
MLAKFDAGNGGERAWMLLRRVGRSAVNAGDFWASFRDMMEDWDVSEI